MNYKDILAIIVVFVIFQTSQAIVKDWTKFEFVSIGSAPVAVISENESLSTRLDCSHSKCFDPFKCNVLDENKRIKVFVYPIQHFVDTSGISVFPSQTREFLEILQAIVRSDYYTDDPMEACLFVPSIDLLSQAKIDLESASQALDSLSFWKQTGGNHLLFNMIPGSFPDYRRRLELKTGHAIIAGAGFDIWSYRPSFDVSIPVFSSFALNFTDDRESQIKRFLICTQFEAVSQDLKSILKNLVDTSSNELFIFGDKCHSLEVGEGSRRFPGEAGRISKLCDVSTGETVSYPHVLSEATFCLVMPTAFLASPTLSDILMANCIPVIVSDEVVLPFQERIDWNRASIKLHPFLLPNVIEILKAIQTERIQEMKLYGKQVFELYFSSLERIALTTLKMINERVIPSSIKRDSLDMSCLRKQPNPL